MLLPSFQIVPELVRNSTHWLDQPCSLLQTFWTSTSPLYKTSILQLVIGLLATGLHSSVGQSSNDESHKYVFPIGSPGFYHGNSSAAVTFDQHSLMLDGKRTLFFSGEFHPFRLPVPELWKDVLQKFKANGFNGVSVYWHWGLSSPREGVVRFTEHNDLKRFYEVAKEVGMLVIQRPGPYINAEAAGGGIPSWTTNIEGMARTNSTGYKRAWVPYIEEFAKQTAPYQYPNGPVIAVQAENEFATDPWLRIHGLSGHMQDIIDTYRANGLTKVPIIHNDKQPHGQYAGPGLGRVDLYGWDGYPLGFDCDRPTEWAELSTAVEGLHRVLNPAEPLALFEWQGGAFDYWSGNSYTNCYNLINEQFVNVYYKNNYAAGVRLQNLYMTYGGTNWGNSQTQTIYSSYDYGAALREDRTQSPKLAEIKLQGYFLHASPDYLVSVRSGNGSLALGTVYSDSPEIYTTHLVAPESKTNFYVVRQTTNKKLTDTNFKLRVNSTAFGEITIPRFTDSITLAGRESKIIVTDYKFGSSKLLYTTGEVLTWATFDKEDHIIVYAPKGQSIEVALGYAVPGSFSAPDDCNCTVKTGENDVSITATAAGHSIIIVGKAVVHLLDKESALGIWAPRLVDPSLQAQYKLTPDIPTAWITGPYLVRTAYVEDGTLILTGDLNATTTISIWGSSAIKSASWNGEEFEVKAVRKGQIQGTVRFELEDGVPEVPVLAELEWKCADSLPERNLDYDDSDWLVANKTSTTRPFKPYQGKNVLYGPEYGFHAGSWIWRGHFEGSAEGVQLSVQTGFAGAMTAFLNGHFLGSAQGTAVSQTGIDVLNVTYTFDTSHLVEGDNVITVYHDSTGMNQNFNVNEEHKTPRGIRGYKLLSSANKDFTFWKVAGNVGGEHAPDYVRGPYNEGGTWFERVGAHLPGYDDSHWNSSCSPLTGISSPGIAAYRAKFSLDFPSASDIPLAFDFELDYDAPHRALIFVNGWQFGRFGSSLGPQTSYPVPEGIINHHGDNEVLIQLWALYPGGAKLKKLELNRRATLSSSKPEVTDGLVKAPDWSELRG